MIGDLRRIATEIGLANLGVAPAIDDVRHAFPWAKSVIVAAICYLPSLEPIQDDLPRGWIARVARSSDYHTVLEKKLSTLLKCILSVNPQAKAEICVDTYPIPERRLAVLGGIACQGKNGNVFIEGCGSYAALGEIVTDLDLEFQQPHEMDMCKECDLCLRACPTQAIVSPGVIDRSRCLSALTQAHGLIPPKLASVMGNRIYGCDTCQEVCPHNTQIQPSTTEFGLEVFPGASPQLIPLIQLDARDFKEQVKDSSIGWIRRTRIRRNATICAGNLRCDEAVPALTEMLQDDNDILREHAAKALEILRGY